MVTAKEKYDKFQGWLKAYKKQLEKQLELELRFRVIFKEPQELGNKSK